MANLERQPKLSREGMDPKTPHGRAQALFDEAVEVSERYGIPVTLNPGDHASKTHLNQPNDSTRVKDTNHHKKPQKTHNTTGLNCFYKGIFYLDGVAQRPKNKQRK